MLFKVTNMQTKHHNVNFTKVWGHAQGLSWKRCKLHSCPFFRGCSIPRCARPVGTLPSFRARCAMAARCLCSATASRIPSKPSSALPATRTACSHVGAAVSECMQCLTQHPPFLLPGRRQRTLTQPRSSYTAIVSNDICNKIFDYAALVVLIL